jgi:hypothetical protein
MEADAVPVEALIPFQEHLVKIQLGSVSRVALALILRRKLGMDLLNVQSGNLLGGTLFLISQPVVGLLGLDDRTQTIDSRALDFRRSNSSRE